MYLYKSQREKEKSLRIRQIYFRRLSKDFTTVYFCKDYATMPNERQCFGGLMKIRKNNKQYYEQHERAKKRKTARAV